MSLRNLCRMVAAIGWLSGAAYLQAADPIPAFMGDWEGRWVEMPEKSSWSDNRYLVARVIGLGGDTYEIQLLQEFDKRAPVYISTQAKAEQGRITGSKGDWKFDITEREFRGSHIDAKGPTFFTLKKVERQSPTLGRKAPKGAVTLVGADDLKAWRHAKGLGFKWDQIGNSMVIVPKTGDAFTKKKFGDCELHMEFRLPYEPTKRGQGRANSGVFFQDASYEVQILDSYGLEGRWNECGALYKVAPPKVNMCAPPGQWQTYDIEYTAPKFDKSGKKTANAIITVRHNGVLIHNQAELTALTAHSQRIRRLGKAPSKPGSISLQDHGHPIAFRNMWVVAK